MKPWQHLDLPSSNQFAMELSSQHLDYRWVGSDPSSIQFSVELCVQNLGEVVGIVLQSDDMNTIPLGLTKFSTVYSTNYVQTLAMAVIASVPVLVIFVIGQRQIINSLMFSGIKG